MKNFEIIYFEDLSMCCCSECGNYFFIHEIPDVPMNLNDPTYCPYCGTKFKNVKEL